MGQQQLLLTILVTIIVGIATIVAINTFGDNLERQNIQSVRQDMFTIMVSSQGYYKRPKVLGGGGESFQGMTFHDATFPSRGISNTGLKAWNENGTYVITEANDNDYLIKAYPANDPLYNRNDPSNATNGTFIKAKVTNEKIEWLDS